MIAVEESGAAVVLVDWSVTESEEIRTKSPFFFLSENVKQLQIPAF